MSTAAPRTIGAAPPVPVTDFVHDLGWADLDPATRVMLRRCLLDLAGTAAGGSLLPVSAIIRDHAAEQHGAGSFAARMLFDGRPVSPGGAALAGGTTIDCLDAHDGYPQTKGHAGAALLPALLAFADAARAAGRAPAVRELLVALAVGYEVAIRAGLALHATVADYHTSGAWNALGCAAIGARWLGLDAPATRHALGIAEYNGPRSQMMRGVDHPTMVKDGSGWGAMVGTSAAHLARRGFTGAPAITCEAPEVAPLWADLGRRWLVHGQYFKPWPVCRWAQPAMQGAWRLLREHALEAADVARIRIATFHEATRLPGARPRDTEQAQYCIRFPVAALLVRGRLGPAEVQGEALTDPAILDLAGRIDVVEDAACCRAFPRQRIADVTLDLRDGRQLRSGPTEARGEPSDPLGEAELVEKFEVFAAPALGAARTRAIVETVLALGEADAPADRLLELLLTPLHPTPERPISKT